MLLVFQQICYILNNPLLTVTALTTPAKYTSETSLQNIQKIAKLFPVLLNLLIIHTHNFLLKQKHTFLRELFTGLYEVLV